MKIQVKDLKPNMMCIYKLNFPNNKIYVGLSCDVRRRMYEHNNEYKAVTPCDLAIKKYGAITEIEILEFVNDINKLGEREKFWIKKLSSNKKDIGYNLTTGGETFDLNGENSPVSTFTNKEVLDIRKRRFLGERKIEVYKDYKSKSFGTFEKIWLGNGYSTIGKEFIIPTNQISRQEYSSKANSGENNNKAKLTAENVLEIRRRYDSGEDMKEIHKDFQIITLKSLARVCRRETWKSI